MRQLTLAGAVIAGLTLAMPTTTVLAQGGPPQRQQEDTGTRRGGQRIQMNDEQRTEAWSLQAKTIAVDLNLSDDKAGSLVDAYVSTRKEHATTTEKMLKELRESFRRGRGGNDDQQQQRGRGDGGTALGQVREQIQAINDASKESLNAKLATILEGESLERAKKSLTTFNPQWDTMVHVAHGFDLAPGAEQSVLVAIEKFVVASEEARPDQRGEGEDVDREAIMQRMREARTTLNETIDDYLNDDQLRELSRAMMGGRGGFRGGAGFGGGRNGDDNAGDGPRRQRGGGDADGDDGENGDAGQGRGRGGGGQGRGGGGQGRGGGV